MKKETNTWNSKHINYLHWKKHQVLLHNKTNTDTVHWRLPEVSYLQFEENSKQNPSAPWMLLGNKSWGGRGKSVAHNGCGTTVVVVNDKASGKCHCGSLPHWQIKRVGKPKKNWIIPKRSSNFWPVNSCTTWCWTDNQKLQGASFGDQKWSISNGLSDDISVFPHLCLARVMVNLGLSISSCPCGTTRGYAGLWGLHHSPQPGWLTDTVENGLIIPVHNIIRLQNLTLG